MALLQVLQQIDGIIALLMCREDGVLWPAAVCSVRLLSASATQGPRQAWIPSLGPYSECVTLKMGDKCVPCLKEKSGSLAVCCSRAGGLWF